MKGVLCILFSIIFTCSLGNPLAKVWLSPIGPLSPLRQYHAQDGSGSYQYSFTGPHHAKTESSLNGVTQGGYSYIDANGILQTVSYTADDENGFRVSASNLPQPPKPEVREIAETMEVAAAKRHHLEELKKSQLREQSNQHSTNLLSYKIMPPFFTFAQIQADERDDGAAVERHENTKNPFLLPQSEAERIKVPEPDPNLSGPPASSSSSSSPSSSTSSSSSSFSTLSPLSSLQNGQAKEETQQANRKGSPLRKVMPFTTIQRQPIALPAPYVFPVLPYRLLHSSLHHTQDSLGQYDYTYTGDSSAKTESRSLDGTTRGAYSYIDPNGILQQVHYIADHNGFRVLATNLPEAK